MKRIALTGGIGAGKSYVCRILAEKGIAVYDCDAAAKRLMRQSVELREALTRLVGDEVYDGDCLQKAVLARFLLASEANNRAVNDIVHPAVAVDIAASQAQWIECAILFESGFIHRISVDAVVCVSAPVDIRVERIVRRDALTPARAMQWIRRQMPQEQVEALSDYVIQNDGTADVRTQISQIIKKIYQ